MRAISLNGSDWTVTGYWPHQWQFAHAIDLGQTGRAPVPAIAATVPGAVHADLLRAGIIPDWQNGLNAERSEWVNNREWVFARTVTVPSEWQDGGRASRTPSADEGQAEDKKAGKMPAPRSEADEKFASQAEKKACKMHAPQADEKADETFACQAEKKADETSAPQDQTSAPREIRLECDGLDYSGVVFVDGRSVGEFEGTHLRHRFDLTGIVRPGQTFKLEFLFHPSPQIDGVFGYTSKTRIFKPRFGYCWDWCPRVVNLGIWQDVRLVCRGASRLEQVRVQTRVEEDLKQGGVRVDGLVSGESARIRYQVTNADNAIVASGEEPCRPGPLRLRIPVDSPKLWWPSTHGQQPLYRLQLELRDEAGDVSDAIERTIGFRHVRWLENPGAPAGAKPYLCEVNGASLFIRGINWVPLSPFYGTVSPERYEAVLRLYRNMNVNLIRVWGGAILETDTFYSFCDRLGIMVWQEFPLSSSGIENWPPEDPAVIDHLQTIATEYVERRGHHASHVLWCGGNELQGGLDGSKTGMGKPVDELHPLMTRWQELLARIEPGKRFQASSPSGPTFYAHAEHYGKGIHHQTHGPWGNLPLTERYAYWNEDDSLFRSESGAPGCSSMAALERHRGDEQLWPPRESNRHWLVPAAAWIPWADVTREFGEIADDPGQLETVVKASRYLQAESYRYAAEASRRRFPTCSGYIIWMGHDNLHNTSNNSVIQIDGSTKPAYDWLRRAFAGRHVSLRHDSIAYSPGEQFVGQVYLHADAPDVRGEGAADALGSVSASLRKLDGRVVETVTCTPNDAANPVLELVWTVPPCPHGLFVVEVSWERAGSRVANRYLLSQQREHPLAPLLALPEARLAVRRVSDTQVEVRNDGAVAAVSVRLAGTGRDWAVLAGDGNLILMPGESCRLTYERLALEPDEPAASEPFVEAFNLATPMAIG